MKNILFMLLCIILLSGCAQQTTKNSLKPEENESSIQATVSQKAEKIEIVLFHATQRCYSCNMMEELTKKTLSENFQNAIHDGTITFKEINGELPENREAVMQYKATGLSVFINSIINGKDHIQEEKNLWRYLRNEEQFKQYLTTKLQSL